MRLRLLCSTEWGQLLDLRGGSFRARADAFVWPPARTFVRWDPERLAGVRRSFREASA